MSVLKSRRNESRAEFVNVAYAIFTETLQFLTKLSTRYSRLLSDQVIHVLKLRRLFYEIYGFSPERIDAFRKAEAERKV